MIQIAEDNMWPWKDNSSMVARNSLFGTMKGQSQDLLVVDDLALLDSSSPACIVGQDKRVYEPRFGLIECLAPAKLGKEEPHVYVDKINWANFPPMEQLAWLFDKFFSLYDREVLMLIWRKRDLSGWLYHVPEQEGTVGGVTWKSNDDEMGRLQDRARWIGTIHIHPGVGCTPSSTDIDDWADPDKSGLHLVFGRDGSYTINGAIAGSTFPLREGSLNGVWRTEVGYTTSLDRPLRDILTIPKPPPKLKRYTKAKRQIPHLTTPTKQHEEEGSDYIDRTMNVIGALGVDLDKVGNLRAVTYDGKLYIMTEEQYGALSYWCDGVCPTPIVGRLRIRPKGE